MLLDMYVHGFFYHAHSLSLISPTSSLSCISKSNKQTGSIDVTWNLSCLTYLIGLPTNRETRNEQAYNDREANFSATSLDMRSNTRTQIVDRPLFTAPQYPSIAPAYRMNETAAWAMASGSFSSLQRAPESFEPEDFGIPDSVLRR
jgi:hypothetical protein